MSNKSQHPSHKQSQTSKENQKKYAQLIAKAWSDETFKHRLKAQPAQALRECGIELPPNTSCEVVENTTHKVYLLIPRRPPENLSEQEMKNIIAAQGFDFPGITGNA